jgi:hypothetical protein
MRRDAFRAASPSLRSALLSQMLRMEKSLESTTGAFQTVRTGRANAAMLDRIQVTMHVSPSASRDARDRHYLSVTPKSI